MSVKVMTLVWDRFPESGTTMLAMLALADWCNDQGGSLYPSIGQLAAKIRVSRSQAQRVLHGLMPADAAAEQRGEWYVKVVGNEFGGRPGTTRQYQLNVERLKNLSEIVGEERVPAPRRDRETGRIGATPVEQQTGRVDATPTGRTDATCSMGATGRMDATGGVAPVRREGSHGCDPNHHITTKEPSEGLFALPAPIERRKVACRLPDDFLPDVGFAESEGLTRALAEREAAKFRDYWSAKAGKDASKLDWQAVWRGWVRRAADDAGRGPLRLGGIVAASGRPKSTQEAAMERIIRRRQQEGEGNVVEH